MPALEPRGSTKPCVGSNPQNGLTTGSGPDWTSSLPEEDAESLVNMTPGKPVRWVPGEGWKEA